MQNRQPFGIKIWGVILILTGGFSSLVTALEIFDSIRFYGVGSLMIVNATSFLGFLVYGVMPVLFYTIGVALYMMRFWALRMVLSGVPFLLLLFFSTQAFHVCKIISPARNAAAFDLLARYPEVFGKFLLLYLAFVTPLVFYFRQPRIQDHFLSSIS